MIPNESIDNYDNYEISELIDQYVRGETARAMLKDRLISRIRFEALAERYNISTRHAKNIIYRAQEQLFKHL